MRDVPTWGWAAFGVTVALLLAIDLFSHRGRHGDSRRNAIAWSVVWIVAGLAFGAFLWPVAGARAAEEYLAAYLIEKSLSLDNLFVFLIVFRSLRIPRREQRRVLYWGILGALVFRAVFVFVGAAALERWHWLEYVFGLILLFAAWRAMRKDANEELGQSPAVRWASRLLPVTPKVEGPHFFVRRDEGWVATPLFVAVCALELTDIVFAIDSVPAAFSVSRHPFIVYSSNAFAILGLRALYVVLEHALSGLRHLHYGLAGVLAFAALKMLLASVVEIPPLVSVGVIVAIIGASVGTSLRRPSRASVRGEPARRRAAGTRR